jgi:hypothetical protein
MPSMISVPGGDLHGRGHVGERDRDAGGQVGLAAHGDDLCGGLRQGVHRDAEAGRALIVVRVRVADDQAVDRLAELLGVGGDLVGVRQDELGVDGDDP